MKPLIVINFKTYQHAKNALKLAKIIENVNKEIIIGVEPTDIFQLSKSTKLQLYSQHVDYFEQGRNTGYILPEAVKENNAIGTFLNHSEHPLDFETIKKTIERCKKINLKTMVFVKDLNQAKEIEKLKPDYLIYEPPELVAGNISVSNAKPEIIKQFSDNIKMKFLVGAGIKNNQDLRTSIKLGASGIALSSAITKARNPGKVLKELIK